VMIGVVVNKSILRKPVRPVVCTRMTLLLCDNTPTPKVMKVFEMLSGKGFMNKNQSSLIQTISYAAKNSDSMMAYVVVNHHLHLLASICHEET